MSQAKSKDAAMPAPESQKERWLKYGGNVALATIIVILLAVLVVYLSERKSKRIDTTATGLYSLKPQTINLIKDNTQKIRIISLYTKSKPPVDEEATDAPKIDTAGQAETVADLLEEYRSKGRNIEVETIDPTASPVKVENLTNEVVEKYGGQVKTYRNFAESYSGKYKKIGELATAESARVKLLLNAKDLPEDLGQFFYEVSETLRTLPGTLQEAQEESGKFLKEKPANYKGLTESVDRRASRQSKLWGQIITQFTAIKASKTIKMPEAVTQYMTDSLPRYQEMKKVADDLVAEVKGLGELKLDDLRTALRQRNSILIRGESEWKIIPYEKVWRSEPRRARGGPDEAAVPPRFAGEQMITTALWAMQHPQKLKVVFVRAGGEPVTQAGFPPFLRPGVFADVSEQLREYNYEVLDKDLTGMAAMQQQRMQAPEPSDAEIKDAVWVVVNSPSQQSRGGPSPTISPKVAEHLMNGGSALFLMAPKSDDMSVALKDFGVEVNTNAVIVHEQFKSEGAKGDQVEQILMYSFVFAIRNWGEHALTAPMRSLPGVLIGAVPVNVKATAGVKSTALIPIPTAPEAPRSWGETDFNSLEADQKVEFNPNKGDLPGPLWTGAAAEKDKSRIVVIGSLQMPASGVIDFQDPDGRTRSRRFPGNSELFMNSIYWLSRQETMIAISPAAMDVSRIGDMSRGTQSFWRVGVLLIGLPGAVIAAGALVWFARRD